MFQTRVGEDALGDDLADAVMVIDAGAYRIAGAAPVHGFVAVRSLGYGADIDHADVVGIGLCQHSFDHVMGRSDIHVHGLLRIVIGRRGDHAAHMEDIVRAGDTRQYIFVTGQVAPYHLDFVHDRFQLLQILFAMARQNDNVEFIGMFEEFLQSRPPHKAGGASEKDSFFHVVKN